MTSANRTISRLFAQRKQQDLPQPLTQFQPRGHIDAVAGLRISGWAFTEGDVVIEALSGDRVIASTTPYRSRPDVGRSFPQNHYAQDSGFVLDLPENEIPTDGVARIRINARPMSRGQAMLQLADLSFAGAGAIRVAASPPDLDLIAPFPAQVVATVAAIWPEAVNDLHDLAGQALFIEKLSVLLGTPELRTLPAISDYARYMRSTWAHCQFVERYFPSINPGAKEGAPDFHCKPNSALEIFSIIHQLYVLKSFGVEGDFAEFGCFKGFSSSMLSFACQQLGITMHIFDSFEGLPEVEGSGYQPGEYAGSLGEVQGNVGRFGVIGSVEFHQGFFASTFKAYQPPHLMCLWMDVDLEVSARDLMVIADRIDGRATIFSHECEPDMFQDGEIVAVRRLDNPIPPVLDRYAQLERPLIGRFIRGNTGALWQKSVGIPVVDNELLIDLVRAV